jgi:glutamyl-tRNA reductase
VVERLTLAIVNKILHGPVSTLKRHQADPSEAFYVEAVQRLFRLDEGDVGDED